MRVIKFVIGWVIGGWALINIMCKPLFDYVQNDSAVIIVAMMLLVVYTTVLGVIIYR